jgi:Uma2 family endonuclease
MSRRRLDRPATWADLEQVPEGLIGEIIAGELIVTPRPNLPHTAAAADLQGELYGPFRRGVGGPGGWLILPEPRIQFVEDVRVPDLGGWKKERWTDPPRQGGPIKVSPDWICEVISPSTEAEDRTRKMRLYARHEVRHYWLLNPYVRTLEAYRLEAGRWVLIGSHTGPERVRVEPFDAIELDLALFWEESPPIAE